MDYRYGSHTVFKIEYHFVWVTKYRFHVLKGDIALRTRELIRQICQAHEIAPSEIMRRIKGRTSRKLMEEFPELKKRYWGQHFWARGYFCTTVGEMTEEMIKHYIEHHFEQSPENNIGIEN